MNDDALRALVRDAIARHVGDAAPATPPGPSWKSHPSHARFALIAAEPESPCMIEPEVRCNQCGYCKSYGH